MVPSNEFIYLLNAFERASQGENPSLLDYGPKRKALLEYVAKLEGKWKDAGERCPQCGTGLVPVVRKNVLNEVHQRLRDMKNMQRASAWPHVEGVARAEKMVWDLITECK